MAWKLQIVEVTVKHDGNLKFMNKNHGVKYSKVTRNSWIEVTVKFRKVSGNLKITVKIGKVVGNLQRQVTVKLGMVIGNLQRIEELL